MWTFVLIYAVSRMFCMLTAVFSFLSAGKMQSLWPEWLSTTRWYGKYALHDRANSMITIIQSLYMDHHNVAFSDPSTYIIYSLILLFCFIFFLYNLNKLRKKVTKHLVPDPTKPRFRKRDKVLFFGRKMLRKVRSSIQGTSKQTSCPLIELVISNLF